MTWFPGMGRSPGRPALQGSAKHEPFTPRVPDIVQQYPILLGFALAAIGIGLSILIITTMQRWPTWLIFPSLLLGVIAMAATVIGSGMVVALALQPLIESKDSLGWDAEPLSVMGIPLVLQRNIEQLGYWTCEGAADAIQRGTFPWTELRYDERQQFHRAIEQWQARTGMYT